MHYGRIKKYEIANGPGVRVCLFVSGCRNCCPNCFQAETWNFDYGQPYTAESEKEILEALKPRYIRGFSLLGGEPFEIENQRECVKLLKVIKETYPEKDIWCYSGYELDKDLIAGGKRHCEVTDEMLSYIDVLVDGRFVEELKDITLVYRGSSNQRLIDLKQSKQANKIIELAFERGKI